MELANIQDQPAFLTPMQCAARLQLSRWTIYHWISGGKLGTEQGAATPRPQADDRLERALRLHARAHRWLAQERRRLAQGHQNWIQPASEFDTRSNSTRRTEN
jgi:predicted DNA-binding transcriptional regulator AlpA